MKKLVYLIIALFVLAACSHDPDYVIGEKDMVDLLVDVHKAEAVIESNYNQYSSKADKKKLREAVFLKHGITQEQFDTNLVWYGHHIEDYMKIYEQVVERLKAENEEAKKLLAEDNSQTMSQPGDSVDVWKQRRAHVFDTRQASNLLTFDIAPDENFRTRDYFELRFKVLLLPKLSVKPQVYLAARHINHDIVYNQLDIDREGWHSLPLQTDSAMALSRINGYIVLPMQTVPGTMYVDSLTLIRRHYNDRIPAVERQKSLPSRPKSTRELRLNKKY
ncbi:DUF4296 domain-containing protein [Barnesiella viscericola]|uniref:DUF4296 domain-containing protein n=1 Tax=Barnesiella viscericola TaxID=397865 RepID=UPI002355932C|nr:DUF4296 domain-containing protein [Barnesiella viscericola]